VKKAIVSGASGFVGRALIKELSAKGVEVLALSRRKKDERIPKEIGQTVFDLETPEMLLEDKDILFGEFDAFYHLAWDGIVGNGKADENIQISNIKKGIETLKVAKKIGCKRFLSAGSIAENEAQIVMPLDKKPEKKYIYGTAKLAFNQIGKAVAGELGIDFIHFKITNCYGPGELSSRMINTTLRKIIECEQLSFSSGTQNYDYIYIDDLTNALYLLGEKGLPFTDYIVSGGEAKQLKDFLQIIYDEYKPGEKLPLAKTPFEGVGLPLSAFSIKKLQKDTGYVPVTGFQQGIEKTMSWLKNNRYKLI
jgi:nucleoside-diphosphate-sugar epimerase